MDSLKEWKTINNSHKRVSDLYVNFAYVIEKQ